MRVSDAERERVATQLRKHYEDGRLAFDEFNARLDEVYAARTSAELEAVLRELPKLPEPSPPARARYARERRYLAGLAVRWAVLNAFAILLWAATGAEGFWPKWVLLVTTFIVAQRAIRIAWPELDRWRHSQLPQAPRAPRPPRPPRPPRLPGG
jgi:hypothetical protein